MMSLENSVVFPKGSKIEGPNFIGDAFLEMLVGDDEFHCPIGNVTFAPGARNSWHKHPGGQILLVTGGIGYYQEKGKRAQLLRSGDVVKIEANVEHWHGASITSYFTHLAITTNPELGPVEWLSPVSDEEYMQVQ